VNLRIPAAWLLAALALAPLAGRAATAEETDARVRGALGELYRTSAAARELAGRARGTLVFPRVIKGGVGIGGGYGEGALLVGAHTAAYYSIASASIGFQLGVQEQSVVLLFMTDLAVAKYRDSRGWKAGVDGSVAIANLGAGESIDTETAQKPIIGFVFSNKGLMYNLTLEGAKITRLKR
jgi:lipid-binding SYLF domain-containing protein